MPTVTRCKLLDLPLLTIHSRMPVLAGVIFVELMLDSHHGLVTIVSALAPPGAARSKVAANRRAFWEKGKRLPLGGLVTVVTKGKRTHEVAIATLTTSEPFPPSAR